MKRIAINGFGRIGKAFLRAVLRDKNTRENLTIAAINIGPSSPENLAIFFKYDSVLRTYNGTVSMTNNTLIIDDIKIPIYTQSDPITLPWADLAIDWVVEASGHFTTREKASQHITAGCKKVLISAPAKNEDITIIPGVNDGAYDATKHSVVSLGSCTTNCFAPIVKVLQENFSLQQGLMTTIHAYTNNQALLDSEHKDPRRGRAAAINIVPTSTGADKVITKIYPKLEGKLQGISIRVPIPTVSLVDFAFTTEETLSVDALNNAFEKASQTNLQGILAFETQPLVSSDYICSPYSCIIDSLMTRSTANMGKVFGWYDNEFGYSNRLKDFLLHNS